MQHAKGIRTAVAAAVLAAAPGGMAQAGSVLDLYYVGVSNLEYEDTPAGDFEWDEGDGYGVKGRFALSDSGFALSDSVFLTGEYQNVEYDEISFDTGALIGGEIGVQQELEIWRAGLGYSFADTPFYLQGEYVGLEAQLTSDGSEDDEESIGDDFDEDGWAAHVGAKGMVTEMLSVHAEIGYVDLGEAAGLEYLAGAGLHFSEHVGIFADYRMTTLEGDDENYDVNLGDARVGLRLLF
ncbi:MAG: outer membrane beta-barrel protein [Pseudomonadota bacterium]